MSGLCLSYSLLFSNVALCQTELKEFNEDSFNLLTELRTLAKEIDANQMLNLFLNKQSENKQLDRKEFSKEFVRELFVESGVTDEEVVENLFNIMDWNNNSKLTTYELVAAFTLFNVGSDLERYQFLFNCLDLHHSGTINKGEFRYVLRCLLEAKFHLCGIKNSRDPDEIYEDLGPESYHTLALFQANQLVRKIFLFADNHRRNKLNWTEFKHWCFRGGDEVNVLKDLLYQTHDESKASELIHPYKIGTMNIAM